MLLQQKTFLIKERTDFLKFSGAYDIYDPETNIQIGYAKEESGKFTKIIKRFVAKQFLPIKFAIYDSENNQKIAEIKNSFLIFYSKITVTNHNEKVIGYFKSKVFTLVGGLVILDHNHRQICELKGTLSCWDFKFLNSIGTEIGIVTKKQAGLGKEFFTTGGNYIITLNNEQLNENKAILLLAAGLAIDIIFSEKE